MSIKNFTYEGKIFSVKTVIKLDEMLRERQFGYIQGKDSRGNLTIAIDGDREPDIIAYINRMIPRLEGSK